MMWIDRFSAINPWGRRRIENYVLQACITTMMYSLIVVAGIILLIDYMAISKDLSQKAELSGLGVFGLLILKSPSTILILLPFAFLFGSLFAFVSLNRRSELIAMRAAGISAWRFILPAATLAFAFGLFTVGVLNPVTSWMNGVYQSEMRRTSGAAAAPETGVIYLRQGDGRTQTVIRAESRNPNAGELLSVSFWNYSIGPTGAPAFDSRIDAASAVLTNGAWRLRNAWEVQPGKSAEYYDSLSLPSNLNPSEAFRTYSTTQSVPFWRLPGLIYTANRSGFSSADYEMKLHELLATPLMFAAMTVLGAVFSLRLMRLGGMTQLVTSGIVLGFIVFFVNQMFTSLGKAGVIPAFLAGWTPALLALLSGITLLVYTEDG